MQIEDVLAIRKIFYKKKDLKLPLSISYEIAKFLKNTDEEERFFLSRQNQMIEQYCKHNKDGSRVLDEQGNIEIEVEKGVQLDQELKELLTFEVDISLSLEYSELEDFTIEELYLLMPYINK